MKYEFSIEKNIHMYNHLIVCKDGESTYSCICESAPVKKETILFWPLDFGLSYEETEKLTEELIHWCESQPFEYVINSGHGR